MLFELTRLTIPRQRRVFRSLHAAAQDKAFMKGLSADTRAAVEAAVEAGAPLDTVLEASPLVVDTTTDSVLSAFEGLLFDFERITNDRVVRLAPEAAEKRADAITLRTTIFPRGAKVILDLSMSDQLKAMHDIATALNDDETAAGCVERLGIKWVVTQVVAHIEPYARAVRASDGRALSADSDAFHAALTSLALKAAVHHEGDGEIEKRLMGAYVVELEGQQADERESRKRSAEKKKGDAPK